MPRGSSGQGRGCSDREGFSRPRKGKAFAITRRLSPGTLLMLDVDNDCDAPSLFPLTVGQARALHTALDKLLAAYDPLS